MNAAEREIERSLELLSATRETTEWFHRLKSELRETINDSQNIRSELGWLRFAGYNKHSDEFFQRLDTETIRAPAP